MTDALRCAGLRTLGLALLAFGAVIPRAGASPMSATPLYYSSMGTVGDADGPISFVGAGAGESFISPGAFSLGHFHADSLPSTATLTYNNTPFHIFANFALTPGGPSGKVEIDGTLNGSLSGNTGSTMFATVTSIETPVGSTAPPFALSGFTLAQPQAIAPHGINNGNTPLMGQLSVAAEQTLGPPTNTPEPASVAVFGATLSALGLWRRRHGRARV